jgi:hypothetical protein
VEADGWARPDDDVRGAQGRYDGGGGLRGTSDPIIFLNFEIKLNNIINKNMLKVLLLRFTKILYLYQKLYHAPRFPRIAAVGWLDSELDSRCRGGEKVVAVETGGGGGRGWCGRWINANGGRCRS